MRAVFFHEDDYCQVEVLPAAAHLYCSQEMGRIDEFAATNWDGWGFMDIYLRGDPPTSLTSFGITLADLRSTIGASLAPFDQVFTGYSSHREPRPSIYAWGLDDAEAIFAEVGDDGLVQRVWLSLYGLPADRLGEWSRSLALLPHASEMLLADWNRSEVLLLKDEQGVESCLRGYIAEPTTEREGGSPGESNRLTG